MTQLVERQQVGIDMPAAIVHERGRSLPMHEPGSRETAVVLEGSVDLFIDGERDELGEGDSVTFDADLPHHFENNGECDARLLAVVAAGLRRG